MAQPSMDKSVYVNLCVDEREVYENFKIPVSGVNFTPSYREGWSSSSYIHMMVKNVDLKDVVDKIYTDGYIFWGRYAYLYIYPSPGSSSIFIKSRDGVPFPAYIEVYYRYKKLVRTHYDVLEDPTVRVLKFDVTYNEFKNIFPKMDYYSINIYWKGGCELVSLKNPDNIDLLDMPEKVREYIRWGWNHIYLSIKALADVGINVNGKWTLVFKEFDKNTPHLYQYPAIAVFLRDRIYKEHTLNLSPGVEVTVKLEDYIPASLPETWHLFRDTWFSIHVENNNASNIEVKDAFYKIGKTIIYCYLYKRSFILKNRGTSTLKLRVKAYINIVTKLNSKTTYNGNLVTVRFNIPSPRSLPLHVSGKKRSLSVYLYHPGFWRQINIYSPSNKPVQEYMEVYKNHIYTLYPVYGCNNAFFSISTGKKPFEGWWTYKAYIPTIVVEDPLNIVDLKPPALTGKVFRDGDRVWAHYSLGEETYINISGNIVKENSTRYVFKEWIGNYYNGSDTIIRKSFRNAELIHERYNWKKQYLVIVQSKYGSVSGAGWYDEGSTATISVSPIETGFPIKKIFDYWSVDGQTYSNSTITITVNKPLTITARWKEDYTMLYPTIGIIIIIILILIIMVIKLIGKRRKEYPPPPPPPSPT